MQPFFTAFAAIVVEKRGAWIQKAGLLSWAACPMGVQLWEIFSLKQTNNNKKTGLMLHWVCPVVSLGSASQFEESCFALYFHSW